MCHVCVNFMLFNFRNNYIYKRSIYFNLLKDPQEVLQLAENETQAWFLVQSEIVTKNLHLMASDNNHLRITWVGRITFLKHRCCIGGIVPYLIMKRHAWVLPTSEEAYHPFIQKCKVLTG